MEWELTGFRHRQTSATTNTEQGLNMTSDAQVFSEKVAGFPDTAIMDALPYAAIICDRNGNAIYCNRALAQLMGLPQEQLINRKASFLSPGLAEDMDGVFASNRPWYGDIVFVDGNGDKRLCELTISPIHFSHDNSSLAAVLMTLLTNDSRQIAERNLIERNQERTDVNALKSDFLANMGHEFRTPLNAIIGNSELIAEGVLGEISDGYRECGKDVLDAGQHLLALVNNVLDVSKLTDGAMLLQSSQNDLVGLANEAVRMIADDCKKRHHTLETHFPEGDIIAFCDRLKIKQILINILSNAAKFTPDGGKLVFELAVRGNDAVFTVRDNGVGMNPVDIPRAMTRFSQLHPDGVKESAGTGLGLPLAKMLTELHGGRIGVDSAAGQGTTVTIRLPLAGQED